MQLLYQVNYSCQKYDAMYVKFLTDPAPETSFYQYNQGLDGLYKYLSEHTGLVSALHRNVAWS